ncbi:HPP family protein [Roseiarcaceae bacterium H3SJ34-1]|uniref:HPP family protein n=1 Tax=Terripilifer ovatus TaxID=3032367 RepID=UPI003AB9AE65|nr:HPP family protein [Roseiarcaceae bacterium H3SJ34-1]
MFQKIFIPAIGGGLGILLMVALGDVAHLPLMLVPFTTSIVLVMSVPDAPFARPQNVIGGHILSAVCGLAVLWALGDNPWLAALAVGLAIAAMEATDTMHPPAGINALIMVIAHPAWTFVVMPVASGALVLVAFSYVYRDVAQRLVGGRKG